MIDQIIRFARLLALQPLTIGDVIGEVGLVEENSGFPIPIRLKPFSRDFDSASLAYDKRSNRPFVLELTLCNECRPRLAELTRQFGSFATVLTDRGHRKAIVFDHIARGENCSVSLIAYLSTIATAEPCDHVEIVTLRRDDGSPSGSGEEQEGSTP